MVRRVLLLHGWTMRGAIFDGLIGQLGSGWTCIAPDLPGHGTAAHKSPSLDSCAEVISDAVETGEGDKPLVIGWSMGAAAAWRYIARFGTARIAGLVTVDMSPKIVPSPDWAHGLVGQTVDGIAAVSRRFSSDWPSATHGIAATMFADKTGAPCLTVEAARKLILAQEPGRMRAMWADLVAMDSRDVMSKIALPYLVCSGAKSRVYPAAASDWIAAHAPQGTRHVFQKSGHSPHLEEPAAFARMVTDFAAQLGG